MFHLYFISFEFHLSLNYLWKDWISFGFKLQNPLPSSPLLIFFGWPIWRERKSKKKKEKREVKRERKGEKPWISYRLKACMEKTLLFMCSSSRSPLLIQARQVLLLLASSHDKMLRYIKKRDLFICLSLCLISFIIWDWI